MSFRFISGRRAAAILAASGLAFTGTVAANAAVRKRNTYVSALYQRLATRRGQKRALVAVAHSLLVAAYFMLQRGEDYQDPGPTYFDARNQQAVQKRLVHRLEQLGYQVDLKQRAVA